ncbi:hypothetical protein OG365_25670 [Streptomyces sp. NBC_00853]|uniref:hypothetical protein n=1 Tax=Streptomyces sp. NBC_00853 TaxID=2903681 RepID=UPI0038730428|nr:hypothetical protein OG365_25670 [Streptomyces sp. NBC_00853]
MKATILNAATTFAIAVLGAGWAYALYKAIWVAVAIPIALAAIGHALFLAGKRKVSTTPKTSVWMMEWGFLGPFFLAVIGAGVIILVAAKFAPGEKATPEEKGIITAASGAVVAAIATVLVGKSESPWVNWVDSRVSQAFVKAFTRRFAPGSAPQLAAHSSHFGEHEGWGRKARRARAEVIADALQNGTDLLPAATSGQGGSPPA